MTQLNLISKGLEDLKEIAEQLIKFVGEDLKIWIFEGEMGVGKTTFIKVLCEALGVDELVNSPTFSIVNEYDSSQGGSIYHFDFYRLNGEEEALDIGIEEYFDSHQLCLIEWPSKIKNLIPSFHLLIDMQLGENNERLIKVIKNEQ